MQKAGLGMDSEVLYPQTLLDLGASPDYKDSRGLTPLYHSALGGGDALCCELLLHDHAQLGTTDENGWQEIHQVRRGRRRGPGCLRVALASGWAASVPLLLLRPAALDMCSTWSTCCSMGPTWVPRMPRETQPCTSAPSTTRYACPESHPSAGSLTSSVCGKVRLHVWMCLHTGDCTSWLA